MLKTTCLSDDAITLIVDLVITRYTLKTNIIDKHDLNRFYKLIVYSNLNRIAFLDFAICHRENLSYEKLSGSPMHNLFLGKINALMANWYLIINDKIRNIQIINYVFI